MPVRQLLSVAFLLSCSACIDFDAAKRKYCDGNACARDVQGAADGSQEGWAPPTSGPLLPACQRPEAPRCTAPNTSCEELGGVATCVCSSGYSSDAGACAFTGIVQDPGLRDDKTW